MKCTICNSFIRGRSDKKFCGVKCKNTHHRNLRLQNHSAVQLIDQILHRNRAICEELMKDVKNNTQMFPRLQLEKMGFNFNYYTGTYLNNNKKLYHYIYDYSWMQFSTQDIMISQKIDRKILKNQ